jgi:hypothetical protein
MGLSCVEACSERACKTDALVGSGDQACLSDASLLLVWAAATRSRAEIIGNADCNNRDFASGRKAVYEQCWTGVGKELTSSSYCTFRFHVFPERSSNFQGFKSPVLWEHRISLPQQGLCWQGMEESFPNTAFVCGLYTNLCTDMQNGGHVITQLNIDSEFLHVSNCFLSCHGT